MSDPKEEANRGFVVSDRRGETKEEQTAKPEPIGKPPKAEEPRPRTGRKIDFSTFVMSLSTSALLHMGLIEDPGSHKREKNLDLARQDVDIIEMMAEKTKGNLNPREAEMMEEILYELRIRFVEASK